MNTSLLPLRPSLETIEQRYFGISPGLIEAVRQGRTPPGVAAAVRASDAWRSAEAGAGTTPDADAEHAPALDPDSLPLPASIAERISRRVKAREHFADDTAPWQAGDLVRIERIVTPRPGQLDAIMQAPLYALLDAPAESPELWHGWLAAAETDYAGWWDFVLQEQDLPFDPEAAMIQLWNPVHLYAPMICRRAGRLSPARLQAVRALAGEFVQGKTPTDVPVWPGHVACRPTLYHLQVVTGSPLGGDDDPRHAYQHLYHHAAEALRQPAWLAVAELAQTPARTPAAFLQHLLEQGHALGAALLARPRLAVAMNDGEPLPNDLVWADMARIRVDELHADGAGCVLLDAIGPHPLTAELHIDGVLAQRHEIRRDDAPLPLCWEAADDVRLALRVAATSQAIELSLTDHTY